MYSKNELEAKNVEELISIAKEMETEFSSKSDKEEIIYAILDKQAVIGSNKKMQEPKKKRTRIAKKEEVDIAETKIETNHGKTKQPTKKQPMVAEVKNENTIVENKEILKTTIIEEQPKKRRGRKSKAELESLAEEKLQTSLSEDTEINVLENSNVESIIETQVVDNEAVEAVEGEMLNVWEDDPADGSDFIVVQDLYTDDQSLVCDNPLYDTEENTDVENVLISEIEKQEVSTTDDYKFDDIITASGILEVMADGYGFLRSSDYNYLSSPDDIYISANVIKQYGIKTGDVVMCKVRPPKDGEKYFPLTSIIKINGREPHEIKDRIPFEHLTPLFPDEKFSLCGDVATTNLSTRIVDLFAPIGKGQRALIVSQPKTGKTILMKNIANAIAANHPEAYLMMLLIDERPEEVTDMARTVNAEVIASTFDEPAERHVKIAGIVLEKAKRLVECGHDVVIFLDSITRLARAYNTVSPASGKVLTGGVDANALQKPKRFFGAARNIEGGGSLTIIATALIDTGSKMDEVIFEEFKGTGNMELLLDRNLSNKRIFPAVNLVNSSTRRDDLLFNQTTIDRMWILRKHLADMTAMEAVNTIYDRMQKSKDNDEFLLTMNS